MTPAFDLCDLPKLFEQAIIPAIRLHKALDLPMVVWENGAVVYKEAAEIESQLRAARERTSSEPEVTKVPQSPLSESSRKPTAHLESPVRIHHLVAASLSLGTDRLCRFETPSAHL